MGTGKGKNKRIKLARKNDLDNFIKTNGNYAYHVTDINNLKEILEKGLYPWDEQEGVFFNSNYDDFFQTRPGHVYMGTYKGIKEYDKYPPLLKIDLRKINHNDINPDEDHWVFKKIDGERPSDYFNTEELPNENEFYLNMELGQEPVSLGEWAENINLGLNPDETKFSLSLGTLSHRGKIKPSAISLNEDFFDYKKWNFWNKHKFNFKSQEELILFLKENNLNWLSTIINDKK